MSQPLTFTKSNFILLQNDIENLQKTIKLISEENIKLKDQVHDMKITVRENKKVLNDYIINITNKDKLFEKLNLIITELKEKIKRLEEKIKENDKSKINTSDIKEILKDKEIHFININQNNNYSVTSQNNYMNLEKSDNLNIDKDNQKGDFALSLYDLKNQNINIGNFNIQNISEKQNIINEELNNIKKELNDIKEQNTLKKKLNQNLKIDINIDKDDNENNNNDKLEKSFNNSYISEEISDLSYSFEENYKKNNSENIFNIKDKYNNIDNLTNYFMKFDEKKDTLLLIDGKNNIWEIIKRNDLSIKEIKQN